MRIGWTLIGAIALIGTLAGCSTPAPTPSPTPKAITLTQSATLDSPKGSKSAELRVVCEGASVALTVGNEEDPRDIKCGTPRIMTVPVGQQLALKFDPQSGTTFTATVRFSRAAFHQDAQLATQCAAASTALSHIVTADNGLGEGAISREQAEALMGQALAALQLVSTDGVAGQQVAALRTWLTNNPTSDPRAAPGLSSNTINELCVDNESPVIIVSGYGG